jgi:arylsulfatase A-like enzyme
MKRREFLRTATVAATGLAMPSMGMAAPQKKKPNFLFLFTDDQTFQSIGCLNNPDVKTPNIDRLVKNGVVFTHAFNQGSWSGAVCIVSRAMLNTGRFIYHAKQDIGGKEGAKVPLWGECLGRAGYQTFMTGKWHNGDAALKQSFKQIGPYGGGMFPSTDVEGDAYYRPATGNTWSPSDRSRQGHWRKTEDGKTVHSSKQWADAAIQFLNNEAVQSDDPFFMYVAFHAPHDPRQSPKKFVEMYPLDQIKIPPNYLPEHPFDQGERNTLRDEILAPFPRTEEAVKVHLQEYYAIISHADHQIGRILDALDKSGKADETIIIFSADHGLACGQHGLLGKQNQYDHSIRMPLIFSGPGIAKGKTMDAMVYLQSVYATTCELAGIPLPDTVEFPSIAPLLEGRTERGQDAIFGSYKDFQRMVRTEDYKLIRYPHLDQIQLFDMKNDPWEMNNLADDPTHKKTIQELNKKLLALQKQVGDEFVLKPLNH